MPVGDVERPRLDETRLASSVVGGSMSKASVTSRAEDIVAVQFAQGQVNVSSIGRFHRIIYTRGKLRHCVTDSPHPKSHPTPCPTLLRHFADNWIFTPALYGE